MGQICNRNEGNRKEHLITTLKLVRDYNLRISEKRKPPSPKYWTTPWANELMSNLPPMGKQRKRDPCGDPNIPTSCAVRTQQKFN
ncbi:hypothetical protein QR680_016515 [Steinernema hermaphroditum]|uniref:Uncharacterized protein n=1 Tax=Steinernema hermaphroditum TaxID=289476 RepID=A0AA39HDF8_9BILA|nr:hypothetical protein QR680_016515 [Steinernema hermaphroditum]